MRVDSIETYRPWRRTDETVSLFLPIERNEIVQWQSNIPEPSTDCAARTSNRISRAWWKVASFYQNLTRAFQLVSDSWASLWLVKWSSNSFASVWITSMNRFCFLFHYVTSIRSNFGSNVTDTQQCWNNSVFDSEEQECDEYALGGNIWSSGTSVTAPFMLRVEEDNIRYCNKQLDC